MCWNSCTALESIFMRTGMCHQHKCANEPHTHFYFLPLSTNVLFIQFTHFFFFPSVPDEFRFRVFLDHVRLQVRERRRPAFLPLWCGCVLRFYELRAGPTGRPHTSTTLSAANHIPPSSPHPLDGGVYIDRYICVRLFRACRSC